MRFGLSDLEELPSLKEFEALAREALGSDEGLAPADGSLTNEASIGEVKEVASSEWRVASEEKASESVEHARMEKREELLEETAASNEGMPENEDSAKTAAAGE